MAAPPHNLRPRYNLCPTDPVDVVTADEDKRELTPMRWRLVPAMVEQAAQGIAGRDVQRSRPDT
jgi:putative SOS response-associated peptidase YedK